jgi:hypothetical protein
MKNAISVLIIVAIGFLGWINLLLPLWVNVVFIAIGLTVVFALKERHSQRKSQDSNDDPCD